MSEEPEDVKPKLNLDIVFDGNQVTIKVKENMRFSKIFQAAEQRFRKESGTLKFIYEGKLLSPDDTPAHLSMDDGDQIYAFPEQVGSCFSPCS